jgi:hypothetical protein
LAIERNFLILDVKKVTNKHRFPIDKNGEYYLFMYVYVYDGQIESGPAIYYLGMTDYSSSSLPFTCPLARAFVLIFNRKISQTTREREKKSLNLKKYGDTGGLDTHYIRKQVGPYWAYHDTPHIVATGQFDHFHVSSRPYNRNPFFFFSFLIRSGCDLIF